MYTLDDLRHALDDQAGAAPITRLGFHDVKRAARRGRHRSFLAGIAVILAPILAAGGAIALSPGEGPSPAPDAKTSWPRVPFQPGDDNPWRPGASEPPVSSSQYIETGMKFGDRERLVLFAVDSYNGVQGGLVDDAGRLRRLGATGRPAAGQFGWGVSELDDRHGGIIDYGSFGAAHPDIRVTAGGQTLRASTAPVPGQPDLSVYWVRRGGTLAGTTAEANPAQADAVIKAYDAHGTEIGTAGGVQRADTTINNEDASAEVGDRIHTGITAAGGGQLVFFFYGDGRSRLLLAGREDAQGRVTLIGTLMAVHQPPYGRTGPGLFYLGLSRFQADNGQTVQLAIYEGPASRVELTGDGAAHQGMAAWSAFDNLHLAWATGITGTAKGIAYDGDGKVVTEYDFERN
ncbi:hypothetical protein [Dactylosporangium sp. NPDC051541]|uniref:hypothetical protein n=1 Tax=Dactylosporangium sp. NPDC051541 TaxID=3363977 RepID=UPI0037B291F8